MRGEIFNLFNRVNLSNPNNDMNASAVRPVYGLIDAETNPVSGPHPLLKLSDVSPRVRQRGRRKVEMRARDKKEEGHMQIQKLPAYGQLLSEPGARSADSITFNRFLYPRQIGSRSQCQCIPPLLISAIT